MTFSPFSKKYRLGYPFTFCSWQTSWAWEQSNFEILTIVSSSKFLAKLFHTGDRFWKNESGFYISILIVGSLSDTLDLYLHVLISNKNVFTIEKNYSSGRCVWWVYERLQIQVAESQRSQVRIPLEVDNLYGTFWTRWNWKLYFPSSSIQVNPSRCKVASLLLTTKPSSQ